MLIAGLDIETTGLEQEKGHRIMEIAVILCDLDSRKVLGKFIQRVNPQRSVDPKAQAVHGISFEEVSKSPPWERVAPTIVKIMQKADLVIAHNGAGFDMPFIGGELIRIGQPIPDVKCFDTMLEGRWATPTGKVPSLRELCFACGVEYDTAKAHAAEYDVEVMLESFFRGFDKGFFKVPELQGKETV